MRSPQYPLRDLEAVKYYWREWYVRGVDAVGRLWHWEPLNTEEACRILINILRRRTATTDGKSGKLET